MPKRNTTNEIGGLLVAVSAALSFMPWSVAMAHGVPDYLRACAKESDEARRLACFDQALERALADPVVHDEGPIRATVTRVSERPDGTLVIALDNGQTWAQKSREYLPVKVGEQVTIRGGAFSSMHLVSDSGRSTRVKRVR